MGEEDAREFRAGTPRARPRWRWGLVLAALIAVVVVAKRDTLPLLGTPDGDRSAGTQQGGAAASRQDLEQGDAELASRYDALVIDRDNLFTQAKRALGWGRKPK